MCYIADTASVPSESTGRASRTRRGRCRTDNFMIIATVTKSGYDKRKEPEVIEVGQSLCKATPPQTIQLD